MKNTKFILPLIFALLIFLFGGIFLVNRNNKNISKAISNKRAVLKTAKVRTKAIVYKSPTCGCCQVYVGYLKKQGFEVEIKDINNTQSIKNKYQIQNDKLSCHTTVIGDYFFEGHIPIEAINKVLKEKPAIKGLALPGMPSGSPGMPGPKFDKFVIYQLANDSKWSDYMSI